MAYSDFKTLSKVRATLNLTIDETTRLFPDIAPIAPSDYLKTTLNEFLPLANAINTEKARSELIIKEINQILGILSTPISQYLNENRYSSLS